MKTNLKFKMKNKELEELITLILKKLEDPDYSYLDTAEHLYDAIKYAKSHIYKDNFDSFSLDNFLWGLENESVIDFDGIIKECIDLIKEYKNGK